MLQRAWYFGSAGALTAMGVLLLGVPMAAAQPPAAGSLTVNPTHGPPTAPLTATFRVTAGGQRCPSDGAAFFWDGQFIDRADFGDTCVARLRFTPPEGARVPAGHQVSATADNARISASARYTVDPLPGPSPSPSPSPTPSASPSPSPRATASATAVPSRATSTPAPDPSRDPPLTLGDSESATPAAVAEGPGSPLPAALSASPARLVNAWTLIAAGGLVLIGALAMGLLFLRSRGRPESEAGLLPVGLNSLMPDQTPTMEMPLIEAPQRSAPEV